MTTDELDKMLNLARNRVENAERDLDQAERHANGLRQELANADRCRDNIRADMHSQRQQLEILELARLGLQKQ